MKCFDRWVTAAAFYAIVILIFYKVVSETSATAESFWAEFARNHTLLALIILLIAVCGSICMLYRATYTLEKFARKINLRSEKAQADDAITNGELARKPPPAAMWLLCLLLSKLEQKIWPSDLEEEFYDEQIRAGRPKACYVLWKQVLLSLGYALRTKIANTFRSKRIGR